MIRNDGGERAGYIYVDLDGVTGVDYVENASRYLSGELSLPAEYSLEWTGAHRYADEARDRLMLVVPLTIVITFVLLLLAFRSWAESALIMFSAPFALVGGVLLQWFQGYPITTAVIIGYVAVLAITVQTGIIMVEFIRDALAAPRRQALRRCGDRRLGGPVAAEAHDGRHDGLGLAAHHARHGFRARHHATHRGAERRRHGDVDDLRACS